MHMKESLTLIPKAHLVQETDFDNDMDFDIKTYESNEQDKSFDNASEEYLIEVNSGYHKMLRGVILLVPFPMVSLLVPSPIAC